MAGLASWQGFLSATAWMWFGCRSLIEETTDQVLVQMADDGHTGMDQGWKYN